VRAHEMIDDDAEKTTIKLTSIELKSGMFAVIPEEEPILGVENVVLPVKDHPADSVTFLVVLTKTNLRCLAALPNTNDYFEFTKIRKTKVDQLITSMNKRCYS
jgi:hypothetical protein